LARLKVAKEFRESLRLAVERIVAQNRVPEGSVSEINALLRHPIRYSILTYRQDRLEVQRRVVFNERIHLLVPVAESAADLRGNLFLIKKYDVPACILCFL